MQVWHRHRAQTLALKLPKAGVNRFQLHVSDTQLLSCLLNHPAILPCALEGFCLGLNFVL
ncbi:hypothetical protein K439DRAFT_1633479 [Ramaria rubella]|nr:hypothetical protein K439DRAFT_1633479 [Ramaria rubella]